MAEIKTLATYKATWEKIKENPEPFLKEHIKFQTTSKPIDTDNAKVFSLGTSARSCESYPQLRAAVKELDLQIARYFLEAFIKKNQRLPKKDEVTNCTIRVNSSIATRKRAGKDAVISFTGEFLPKV